MVKRRGKFVMVVFVIILLFSIFGSAAEEEVFSGTVEPGTLVNVSNEYYIFSLSSDNMKLSVDFPDGTGLIVANDSCELRGYVNACFGGAEYWYQNYTLDKEYYKAAVTINNIVSDIDLERTDEDVNLLIGEETKISMTLENGFDRKSTNIVYSDPFPSSFVVTGTDNCVIELTNSSFSTVKWTGNLEKGIKRGCEYTIKALENISYESTAVITYFNGVSDIEEESGSIDIDVEEYQLNASLELSRAEMDLGEEVDLKIHLDNINEDKTIRIEVFEIQIPIGLEVVVPPKYLKRIWREFWWEGSIEEEDSRSFTIKLRGEHVDDFDFVLNIGYILAGVRKDIEETIGFKVKGNLLTLDSDVTLADEGGESTLGVKVKNPSSKYQYKDIELKVGSSLPGFDAVTHKLGRLDPLSESEVVESFIIPEEEIGNDHVMILDLVYGTEYDQILKVHDEKVISESAEEEIVEVVEETEQVGESEGEGSEDLGASEGVEEVVEETVLLSPEEKPSLFGSILFFVIIAVETFFVILAIVAIKGFKKGGEEQG